MSASVSVAVPRDLVTRKVYVAAVLLSVPVVSNTLWLRLGMYRDGQSVGERRFGYQGVYSEPDRVALGLNTLAFDLVMPPFTVTSTTTANEHPSWTPSPDALMWMVKDPDSTSYLYVTMLPTILLGEADRVELEVKASAASVFDGPQLLTHLSVKSMG